MLIAPPLERNAIALLSLKFKKKYALVFPVRVLQFSSGGRSLLCLLFLLRGKRYRLSAVLCAENSDFSADCQDICGNEFCKLADFLFGCVRVLEPFNLNYFACFQLAADLICDVIRTAVLPDPNCWL